MVLNREVTRWKLVVVAQYNGVHISCCFYACTHFLTLSTIRKIRLYCALSWKLYSKSKPNFRLEFFTILEVDDHRQSFLISFWVGKEANLGRNCGAKNGHYSRLNCPSGDKRSFKGRWFLCSFRFWRLVVVRRTLLVCVWYEAPLLEMISLTQTAPKLNRDPKKNFCHLHFFKWPHTDFLLDRIILLYFFLSWYM